jgi:hypothetical protein
MKKVLFVLVLMMAILVVNAQATKTTVTNAQSTRTTVKVEDLQKAITDNVAKDFVGFTIKDAASVTANNLVTYEVVIVKGNTTETLVYDKDGKFVKKLAQKAGTIEKKVVKTTTTTTTTKPKK